MSFVSDRKRKRELQPKLIQFIYFMSLEIRTHTYSTTHNYAYNLNIWAVIGTILFIGIRFSEEQKRTRRLIMFKFCRQNLCLSVFYSL